MGFDMIKYIDSTWIGEQIWYKLSSNGVESRNISKFLKEQMNSKLLDPIIISEGWDKVSDHDRLIYLIQRWVQTHIHYKSDTFNYKALEYWATVNETLTKMSGDCEDGACLIIVLGRKCGIPVERLKLWCGNAEHPFKDELVGHACAIYKSENYQLVWFFMDWCYYPEMRVPGRNRTSYMFSENLAIIKPITSEYIDSWFVVDEEKGSRRLDR